MKKLFTLLFCVISLSLFAQITIPVKSENGIITTQTQEKIYYKNLSYNKGKLTYINLETGKQEFLYDASILEIKENVSLPVSQNTTAVASPKIEKLTSDEDIKNYLLKNNNAKYLSGKSTNSTGNIFLYGGLGVFLGGGILNLSSSSKVIDNGPYTAPTIQKSGGVGSVPLIIGLASAGLGVVLKISGNSKMKEAVQDYKTASVFSKENLQKNLSIVADNKGFGLQLKF